MKLLALVLTLALAPFASASAEERLSQSWEIAFTAAESADTATAYVVGEDPAEGAMVLLIHDADGRLVFQDAWPMSWFHSNIPGPEGWYGPEKSLAAVTPQVFGGVDALPTATALVEDQEGGATWLETDAETYERARATGGPLLCYAIAHESSRCAWYDAERSAGVALYGNGV